MLTQRHCTSGEGGQLGSPLQREQGTRGPGQGILYLLFSPPPKLWIQAITPHLPQRAKLPPKASAKESIRILQHRELPKSHFLRPSLSLFHFVHSHFSCLARHTGWQKVRLRGELGEAQNTDSACLLERLHSSQDPVLNNSIPLYFRLFALILPNRCSISEP